MQGLNLSKFKKIASGKDHSILKSHEGHEIKVLHKPLSPKMRKALESLEMTQDGKVPDAPAKFAGGGSVSGDEMSRPCKNPNCKSHGQPHPNCKCYADGGMVENDDGCQCCEAGGQKGGEVAMYADGGNVSPEDRPYGTGDTYYGTNMPMPQAAAAPSQDIPSEPIKVNPSPTVSQAPEAAPQPTPIDTPPAKEAAADLARTQTEATASMLRPNDPMGAQTYGANLMDAYNKQVQGFNNIAAGNIEMGKLEADKGRALAEQAKVINDNYTARLKHLDNEIQNTWEDVKAGHIDPHRFYNSKSTPGKISTAIGLLLGGLGSGLTRGPNQALDFINKQIDRDIDAQKAEMHNKQNLLGHLNQQYGNIEHATNVAKAMMEFQAINQLQSQAAKAKTQLAQGMAQQAIGQLQASMAGNLRNVAIQQSLTGLTGGMNPKDVDSAIPNQITALRASGNEPLAKHLEERYVPGVGLAKNPVQQGVRDKLTDQATLLDLTKQIQNFAKKGSTLSPVDQQTAATLLGELKLRYRKAMGDSVSESQANHIEKILGGNPLSVLSAWNSDPALKALNESMTSANNVLRRSVGLPEHEHTKIVNGIKYKRGPNGEAIRVE